jgi:ParB-like chromosome segregation protein Spo0J
MSETEMNSTSWRDHLPIHPAAAFFPMMSEEELKALGEDIETRGMMLPIVILQRPGRRKDALLDGRNRLAALEAAGFRCEGTLRVGEVQG